MAALQASHFNPRSPCGERQKLFMDPRAAYLFQPTLPVRGATIQFMAYSKPFWISTHAPRAGSDIIH